MNFCSWKRPEVYTKLPNVTFADMGKILGLMWNNLSADEKAVSVIVITLTLFHLNDTCRNTNILKEVLRFTRKKKNKS